MKINPVYQNIIQNYKIGKTAPRGNGQYLGGADQVSFSEDAVSFSKMMAQIKEDLALEAGGGAARERLADLKGQIERGTYQVDSRAVAERIISDILGDEPDMSKGALK